AAVQRASFLLLAVGMVVLGIGHSSNQLARYAAGDLYASTRRASVMGWIIWAGTIGALAGPNMVAPAQRFAEGLGLTGLAGGYLVVTVFFAVAAVLLAVAVPSAAALAAPAGREALPVAASARAADLLRTPRARAAALAMVVGQSVMILVMTVTPVHLGDHGQGLGGVGLVMSAHLVGMYVFAPIGGRIADRVGSIWVILAGQALLALSALLAAVSRPTAGGPFLAALLLLGIGWSFGLVGGSSLLTQDLNAADAVRLQGATESAIWIAAAGASVASGLVLSSGGYPALCIAAACLALAPIAVIILQRRSLTQAIAH
ncbi:MAG TPA: MFS transporter, partial [Egibacteraceae bacterium]|nr:MFS transporter [Egibacteraceae bacterium]